MNVFSPSARIRQVNQPPISVVMDKVRELRESGVEMISMAQATPWYGPPESSVKHFQKLLLGEKCDSRIHSYSPDPGFISTRKAVTDDFQARRGISLDPACEIHITCGASQAFFSALTTVTDTGDRVIVLEPYYFDHVFAIRFSDLSLVSMPMKIENNRWILPRKALENEIPLAKALVLVNPGNPTGAVLSEKELLWLSNYTRENNCFLLIDETYERFNYSGSTWHPRQEKKKPRHILTFGSFSKSLGMPGWRIGYLFGEAELLSEALKVQDSVVICPPAPSQLLLESAIKEKGWIKARSEDVRRRKILCKEAMERTIGLEWMETGGGFFTLARINSGRPSMDVVMELIDKYSLATIPGSAFGPSGEYHIRISFGCLSDEDLPKAMEILSSVEI